MHVRIFAILAMALLFTSGCVGDEANVETDVMTGGDTTTVAECVSNDECDTGEVCKSGVCIEGCLSESDCPAGEYCTDLEVCAPYEIVLLVHGDSCSDDAECASTHCQNGFCCDAGDCCVSATDCPDRYATASVCLDVTTATTCQGEASIALCTDNTCVSNDAQPDDSGCVGVELECGYYKPLTCTDAADQEVPVCPITCEIPQACVDGTSCVDGVCVPPVGLGESCIGTGQGSCEPNLKCENDVCCASGTCCADSSVCPDNMGCDVALSACYTTCNDLDDARCADPSAQLCANDACVDKAVLDTSCDLDIECVSGVCECFDAECTTKKCRVDACPTCEFAVDQDTCGGLLGDPAPLEDTDCEGSEACYNGQCLLVLEEACTANAECGDVCIGGVCAPVSELSGQCDMSGENDCAEGHTCANGVCLVDDGGACTTTEECVNAQCSNGTCCSTACDGPCAECSTGTCQMPTDDDDCGTISCDGLDTDCRNYSSVTANRCDSLGACKPANDSDTCTHFVDAQATTLCGTACQQCDGAGACSTKTFPVDDDRCNDIDCDKLDSPCRDYTDLKKNRCAAVGTCKPANDSDTCTDFRNAVDTTLCGTVCQKCDGNGACSTKTFPADDNRCGTIDCDKLDFSCRDYHDLTTNRCKAVGYCKDVTTKDCTSYKDAIVNTDCGDCQQCDGKGTCNATFCEAGDACDAATDMCQFVVLTVSNCTTTCQTTNSDSVCISVGDDATAGSNIIGIWNGSNCLTPKVANCATIADKNCIGHNCRCEYGP